jgi:hypothetical protein
MTDTTDSDTLAEKETRIRQMIADIELKALDRLKRLQDIEDAPQQLTLQARLANAAMLTAGAALATALVAFGAFVVGHHP